MSSPLGGLSGEEGTEARICAVEAEEEGFVLVLRARAEEESRTIRSAIGLECHPVGVNFLRDLALEQDVERAKGHRFCQAVMRARQGERLLLTAEDIACPAAASALGFKPLPSKLETGEMLKGFGIFQDESMAARTIRAMPRLELGKYSGTLLGPLGSFPVLPDVVLLEGPVEKLMWVALAYLNASGGRLYSSTAVLQAICVDSAVLPFLQDTINLSYGCYGCREATDLGEGEAALGFPGPQLPMVAENLLRLREKAIPRCRERTILRAWRQRSGPADGGGLLAGGGDWREAGEPESAPLGGPKRE